MSAEQHDHCDKCYNRCCQVPVQLSVSCLITKCRKNCGAIFHMCKEKEHQLLCPNESVPCLNCYYGCPLTMLRHRLSKHLEVCPASIVNCSQEWNRWPVADTNLTFYRNLPCNQNNEHHLDVSTALGDQELLFQSIKMKNIFPELMISEDPALKDTGVEVKRSANGEGSPFDHSEYTENHCRMKEESKLSQEERNALATSKDLESIQNHSSWEGIFKKEMEACKQTVKNLNKAANCYNSAKEEKESANETRDSQHGQEEAAAANANSATGLAPWQDGVLERLGREVNIGEYNMYLVHHGAMLITFGQLAACTPREKDFVYGNLEPIDVQTVRSFNVPSSYRAKRYHLKDPMHKAKTEHKSVDTAELGVLVEDLPKSDEVSATLLCCLENELKGHLISQSMATDGLYIDVGTQTYNFASALFKADASLADVIAAKPQHLYVNMETESVTRRHNKTSSAFSYVCGHVFRRDEYCTHFKNVHLDIQASLNGWFQQRCPLAYLGCTFTQTRFHPSRHQAAIKYCRDLSTFVLHPVVSSSLCEDGTMISHYRKTARDLDPLSSLPLEILQHVAAYLDSFTLSQLSQVSHLMREVCATLLHERGMVSLKWDKNTYSNGGTSWKCQKKVWEFSSLFSAVDSWSFSSNPSMSDHLKSCSFYQREERSEPVALTCLWEARDKHGHVKQKT